jgi:hypothetical protein
MKKNILPTTQLLFPTLLVIVNALLVGCQSQPQATQSVAAVSAPAPVAAPVTPAITPPVAPVPAIAQTAIRIKAGASAPFTDAQGNVWLAEQGFVGGDSIERPDLTIANTTEPNIYRSEHYSMDSFTYPVANGKYLVKLHFCETYDGIDGVGQRVFSFNVQGREIKDFDVWAKAGGGLKAYVESIPVEVKDGNLKITFTSNVENPQINGIEIIPQP